MSGRRKRTRVLVLGVCSAAYRPGAILRYFADRSGKYSAIHLQPISRKTSGSFFSKLIFVCIALVHIPMTDLVVIMPMAHRDVKMTVLLLFARLLEKRIVSDFYISAYETRVIDRKLFRPGSLAAKRQRLIDRLALDSSNPAIFLTEAERDYYSEVVGAKGIRSAVIPLLTPPRSQASTPYLRQMRSYPTIAWWGRVGNPVHGFECIAEAIKRLIKAGVNAKFAILAADETAFDEFARKHAALMDSPDVLLTKSYSFADGSLERFIIDEVDIALGTFGETRKAKTVLVNKVLDAASFGLPVITQHSSGAAESFVANEAIIFCRPDPAALSDAIVAALSKPAELRALGYAAKRLAEKRHSYDEFASRFDALLK